MAADPVIVAAPDSDAGQVFVVRADGSATGPVDVPEEVQTVQLTGPDPACAVVTTESSLTLLRLVDGRTSTVDEFVGGASQVAGSADGCSVIPFDSTTTRVVTVDGIETAAGDGEQLVGISPDGAVVAVRDVETGRTEVRPVAGEGDRIDIDEATGGVFFVRR